ncbi:MAG: M23 family metallopeptidase [Polyangiaceae bacterium]
MKTLFSNRCSALTMVLAFAGTAGCMGTELDAAESGVTPTDDIGEQGQAIAVPANMGRYCSMRPPAGDGFQFYASPTEDPCAKLRAALPTWVVHRAGYYSNTITNFVVMNCNNWNSLTKWRGMGLTPMSDALNYAAVNGLKNCVFNVAPYRLPIFKAPFLHTNDNIRNNQIGVWQYWDHSLGLLDVTHFGRNAPRPGQLASYVDWEGYDDSSVGFIENHWGWDYGMKSGTPILAVANGTVVMARSKSTPECGTPSQNEIFIRHTVGSGDYTETFLSFYAHMVTMNVRTGDSVTQGQQIGLAGSTGCSSGPHLHFGVSRESNLMDAYRFSQNFSSNEGHPGAMDPYGWAAPKGVDPMSYTNLSIINQGRKVGALSSRLWIDPVIPEAL